MRLRAAMMPRTVKGELTQCSKPQSHAKMRQEATMAKLTGMTVEALMDLRERVDEMLHRRRAEIEKQLERFAVVGGARVVGGGGSALKGRKVPPKYRGP